MLAYLSAAVLAIWVGLWLARTGFWKLEQSAPAPLLTRWPSVVCVIPARNEAEGIAQTLRSLWEQGYPGDLRTIVVDDQSVDGTEKAAIDAAAAAGRTERSCVIRGSEPPPGWIGKVWAMQQGLDRADHDGGADYVLFSDADICHGPAAIQDLVCRAESGPCDMVSLMVRLRCETGAEQLMMPAFVFFFRLLYPFRRINNPRDPIAGAAGGTMLVRHAALSRIGDLTFIRGEVIDDCSLAREIKRNGHRIWLGLSSSSHSNRRYDRMSEVVRMISRTAYAQLERDPVNLAICVLGLAAVFLAPPVLTVLAGGAASLIAGLAWLLMAVLYAPILRYYQRSLLWAPLLPVTAAVYLWATLVSAWLHHTGSRGEWRGRRVTGPPE